MTIHKGDGTATVQKFDGIGNMTSEKHNVWIGDRIAGDKVAGDKVMGNKVQIGTVQGDAIAGNKIVNPQNLAEAAKEIQDLILQTIQAASVIAAIALLQPIFVQAQTAKTLKPVCIGITSPDSSQAQASCCQVKSKGTCKTLEQAFPGSANVAADTEKQIPLSQIEIARPAPVFKPRTSGSEAAAKDAVVQMGVTKMLDVMAPNTEGINPSSPTKPHRKDSFFQRARQDMEKIRQDYEYVFRPRPLESGAVITPKLNVDFSSLKAGFKIEF